MMKSTLIKDLYGEIERLKAEVYATREKNGVYIPKERYYQEESERKAMADQIEQMGVRMENHQQQMEELESKYERQIEQCTDLSQKLDATQKDLNQTNKLLANTKEELKECQYCIKERDFVISEQKKAENALAHQACVLRADLEKSQKDNTSLFLKIAREDKLNSENRSTLNSYQADLTKQLDKLCKLLAGSTSQQSEYLQGVEILCQSFLEVHNKAALELKKKVSASRTLCVSHFEAVQNVVRLHKAGSNASLDELSDLASSNSHSIREFLAAEAVEMNSVFDDLQQTLSSHQGEMADLARELRQRFNASVEHLTNASKSLHGFIEKLSEESERLGRHATKVDDVQTKCITEFRKAYEEQSRTDAQKLIADVTTLVSECLRRQKEMVDTRLGDLNNSVVGNKMFLDGHISSVDGITLDLKRKWQDCFTQSESNLKDNADFSAAKHCRMELLLQKCVNTGDAALNQWQRTKQSLTDMSSQHAATIVSNVRSMSESNEQHDAEVESARVAAEKDAQDSGEDIIRCFDDLSEREKASVSETLATARAHSETIQKLKRDHSEQSACIEQCATDTFSQKYMDYEPTGSTPIKCEPDIPSKSTIESLRAMPMETLQEEFRENHSLESFVEKDVKIHAPRSPFSQIN